MRNRTLLFLFLLAAWTQHALGAVVRVADGDCAALSAAASSAPGTEPSLIVLATRGHYGACALLVTGNITIDGAGSFMVLVPTNAAGPTTAQVQIETGGSLLVRNINLGVPAGSPSGTGKTGARA